MAMTKKQKVAAGVAGGAALAGGAYMYRKPLGKQLVKAGKYVGKTRIGKAGKSAGAAVAKRAKALGKRVRGMFGKGKKK